MGVFVNPQILNDAGQSDIDPPINAQKTDANGHYGWDVVEGCWYITVQARGYRTVYSPVVGVPPAVMDLDLDLPPNPTIFLPIVTRN
jgi:hypothetical protein